MLIWNGILKYSNKNPKKLVFIWTIVIIYLSQFKQCCFMLAIPRDSEQIKEKRRKKKKKRYFLNHCFVSERSEP